MCHASEHRRRGALESRAHVSIRLAAPERGSCTADGVTATPPPSTRRRSPSPLSTASLYPPCSSINRFPNSHVLLLGGNLLLEDDGSFGQLYRLFLSFGNMSEGFSPTV